MTDSYKNILFWNKNHSHPEYAEGCEIGELDLYPDGIVFRFRNENISPLVIAWKNLQSTYPSVHDHPSGLLVAAWYLSVYGAVATIGTLGAVAP